MQECNIILRHGGSPLHEIPKQRVTPAEIQVLKAIHGPDSVPTNRIEPTKLNKRNHAEEYKRLVAEYGGSGTMTGDEPDNVVARLFPGVNPRLPTTLKEIGLEDTLKPTPDRVVAVATEDADDDSLEPDEDDTND